MAASPALDRLGWILDGLNGTAGWGADADDMLAPEFTARVPPGRFADLIRKRATVVGPATVTGFDVTDETARARVRGRDGSTWVVSCAVQPRPPHAISSARTMPLIPEFLNPPLPADFAGHPELSGRGEGAALIVFSGLPGTGKSTLADATGRELRVPVFGADWLLGALTPFGGYHLDRLLDIGSEMLTTLAFRQLQLGQPTIVDHPFEDAATRNRLRTLAGAAGAEFPVVLCTCSDPHLHRTRLERRTRGIPGWHESGDWANVERRRAAFTPWDGEVLTVDTARPVTENLAVVLDYVARFVPRA